MDDSRTRRDAAALAAGGALFLALAAFFLWRDLELPREVLMLAATLVAGIAAVLAGPRRWPAVAPAALLATNVVAGLWFLAEKRASLLPALAAGLVASLLTVLRAEGGAERGTTSAAHRLRWYGLGVALLAAGASFYFHFFTLGAAADSVARRLVPTVAWLAIGLALFVAGRRRTPAAAHVGLGLVAVALGKAVVYDTTHLAGGLRITVLAAAGVLLLFAATAVRRSPPRVVSRPRLGGGAAREAL